MIKNKKIIQTIACALLSAFLFTILSEPYAYSKNLPSSRKKGVPPPLMGGGEGPRTGTEGAGEKGIPPFVKGGKGGFLTLSQLKHQYLKNLENLKDPADNILNKQIEVIKDTLQNRISFSPLLERSDKRYLIGAYHADHSRVHFVIEYVKETETERNFSRSADSFLSELKSAVGTLRVRLYMDEHLLINALGQSAGGTDWTINRVVRGTEVKQILIEASFNKLETAERSWKDTVPASLNVDEQGNTVTFTADEKWENLKKIFQEQEQVQESRQVTGSVNRPDGLLPIWSQERVRKHPKKTAVSENVIFQGILTGVVSLLVSALTGYNLGLLLLYTGITGSIVFALLHYRVYHDTNSPPVKPRLKDRLALLGLGFMMSAVFAGSVLGIHTLFQHVLHSKSLVLALDAVLAIPLGLILSVLVHLQWNKKAPKYDLPLGMISGEMVEQDNSNNNSIEIKEEKTLIEVRELFEKDLEEEKIFIEVQEFYEKYPEMEGSFSNTFLITHFSDLKKLEQMAGEVAGLVFNFGLPALKKAFPGEEFNEYWPDFIEMGKAAKENASFLFGALMSLRKASSRKEFKEYWPNFLELARAEGKNAASLFEYGLPALRKAFPGEEFERYWPDFFRVAKAVGAKAASLFQRSLPALRDAFSKEEFNKHWPKFLELGMVTGDPWNLFANGLPASKKTFPGEEFERYWPDLFELAKTAGENALFLLQYTLPALRKTFPGEEFERYWPNFLELAKAGGKNIIWVFEYGFSAAKDLIRDPESLNEVGKQLIELCKAAGNNAVRGLPALKSLIKDTKDLDLKKSDSIASRLISVFKNNKEQSSKIAGLLYDLIGLIEKHPASWNLLIYPVFEMKEANALASLKNEKIIDDVIQSDEDLVFIKDLIEKNKKNASSLIKGFLVAGINKGLISTPVSKDRKIINNFLNNFKYQSLEIYKQYKNANSSKKQEQLKAQCESIHKSIVAGSREFENDPLLLDILFHTVFPPSGEDSKEEYEDILSSRPDYPEHTAWVPESLQNKPFELQTGQYELRHPEHHDHFNPNSAQNILAAIKEVNSEKVLQEQMSQEQIRQHKLNLAETLLNEWSQQGRKKIDRMDLLKQIYDYHRMSGGERLEALVTDSAEVQELMEFIGDTVKDLIREVIRGYQEEVVDAIHKIIVHQELKKMNKEFDRVYKFTESDKQSKFRFVVSKRSVHGVFGFNMGVCTASDEKLWDNKNYFHAIIFDEEGMAWGGMQLLIIEEEGKKYLAVVGLNPSKAMMEQANARQLCDIMLAYAWELADELKIEQVYIPTDELIYSNRPKMIQVIKSKNYSIKKLTKKHEFSYDPDGYSFQKVYVVPKPQRINHTDSNNNNQVTKMGIEGKQEIQGLLPFWSQKRVQNHPKKTAVSENVIFQGILMGVVSLLVSALTGYNLGLLLLYTGITSSIVFAFLHYRVYRDMNSLAEKPKLKDRLALLGLGFMMSAVFAGSLLGIHALFQPVLHSKSLVLALDAVIAMPLGLILSALVHLQWNKKNSDFSIRLAQRIREMKAWWSVYSKQEWKDMNEQEQQLLMGVLRKTWNVPGDKKGEQKERRQIIQDVQNGLKERGTVMQKSAIVLDLRDNSESTQETLKLALETYRSYRAEFPEDKAGLVLIGKKGIRQKFMMDNGISDRELLIDKEKPQDVISELKEKDYVVKVFTAIKEGWPEYMVAYWINKLVMPLLTLEQKEEQRAEMRLIMIQA